MKIYFSAATGGWYFDAVHGTAIPPDSKEVSNAVYQALVGKAVIGDADGMPIVRPPPKYFYCATTGGFYIDVVHGDSIPADAKEVSEEVYQTLAGRDVVPDAEGLPMLRPAPKFFFSASTGGFYTDAFQGLPRPDDANEISRELYESLIGRDVIADGEGLPILRPATVQTLEDRAAVLLAAVDAHLNAAARAKRYDDIGKAALRAGYPGPFHDEGMAFATWMDAVYAKCYELMAKVQAGEMAEPNAEQLIAMLPELVLPA